VIRFVMLSTHYSKPMDWTEKKAEEAEKTLDWLYSKVGDVPLEPGLVDPGVQAAMADDLNTSLAITRLKDLANDADARAIKATAAMLGLLPMTETEWKASKSKGVDLSVFAAHLAAARADAMASKDFSMVDKIKAGLVSAGVEVRMSKDGVELIPGSGFDPAKLEAIR